jgi:hypothetical protein
VSDQRVEDDTTRATAHQPIEGKLGKECLVRQAIQNSQASLRGLTGRYGNNPTAVKIAPARFGLSTDVRTDFDIL